MVGKVEQCYSRVVEYFFNIGDPITAAFWARKMTEIIIRSTIKKDNFNADENKRTYDLIKYIKKNKLAPPTIILNMVNVNNFANTGVHGDLMPDDMEIMDVYPIIPSLKALYDWYKEDIEPFTEEEITPKYIIGVTKEKSFHFKPIDPEE